MSNYNTNLASEYYALASLYRLGVEAYLTLGNKKSVDIIVTTKRHKAITIEVKGVAKRYDWPAQNIKKTDLNHFYVLLSFEGKMTDLNTAPTVWVVPGRYIKKFIISYRTRCVVSRKKLREIGDRYKDNWRVITQRAT